jgi:hypothetical protein
LAQQAVDFHLCDRSEIGSPVGFFSSALYSNAWRTELLRREKDLRDGIRLDGVGKVLAGVFFLRNNRMGTSSFG